jgi:hypothetical protein
VPNVGTLAAKWKVKSGSFNASFSGPSRTQGAVDLQLGHLVSKKLTIKLNDKKVVSRGKAVGPGASLSGGVLRVSGLRGGLTYILDVSL